MNQIIANRWAAALASSLYTPKKPSISKIRHENTYGVLGILCEVYRLEHGGEWISSYFVPPNKMKGEKYWPPDEVIKWAGMRGKWGAIPGVGVVGLMEDNGVPHYEIAQCITDYWESL